MAFEELVFGLGLADEERTRLNKYKLYRRFYGGIHWEQKKPKGEVQLVINYCQAMVDKGVNFLMSSGFAFIVSPEYREKTLPVLEKVWLENKKDKLSLEMAQMGGITGDDFVKVTYDDEEKKTRLISLNSEYVYPEWDLHDKTKMTSCQVIYPLIDYDERGRKRYRIFREVITNEEIREFLEDAELTDRRRPNILEEIPIVHIVNIPIAGEHYGRSDLSEIVPLNREFNYKATNISNIINYHEAPITIVYGAKAKNVEKGARKTWYGLPKDAKVENLALDSDLGASQAYLELIKLAMHEIGQIPEATLGKQQAISNTSGVALHIQYMPLVEKTWAKRITYGDGIKKINELILKIAELKENAKFGTKPDRYDNQIEWKDALPKDKALQIQQAAQEINLEIGSKREWMRKLGKTNIDELEKEIKQEKLLEQERFLETPEKTE